LGPRTFKSYKEIDLVTPKQKRTGASLKPLYIALAIIALGGVGFITYSVIGGGSKTVVEPVALTGLEDPQALLAAAKGVSVGPADARVKVMVFSDFTCPSCRHFTQEVEPYVKREFAESGKIQFVYYDFPLGGGGQHRHSFLAARAARCADEQGKFWEYHDVLFAQQGAWSYASKPPIDDMKKIAAAIGLQPGPFASCLESDRHADVVSANKVLGETVGVGGTPTVFIGMRPVQEWNSWPAVREAIQRELGEIPAATSGQ
jgi:protein-disulfide isomerase